VCHEAPLQPKHRALTSGMSDFLFVSVSLFVGVCTCICIFFPGYDRVLFRDKKMTIHAREGLID
jgi:hypothetical protein